MSYAWHICGLLLYTRYDMVCLCVCLCVSVRNRDESCKTAEPIEKPFGMWAGVDPRNYVLDGGVRIPLGEGAILG